MARKERFSATYLKPNDSGLVSANFSHGLGIYAARTESNFETKGNSVDTGTGQGHVKETLRWNGGLQCTFANKAAVRYQSKAE